MGIPCNAISLPKRIQFLQVGEFNQITRLSELPLNDSQQDLKELVIYSFNSIEFIVPEDEEGIFLQRIESMRIELCQSLSKIYEKVPAHGAFPCMKSVGYCTKMEELIVEDSGAGIDYTVTLPRLKTLFFASLPKLKSIWKGVMVCDSLQTVQVHCCPELKRLPLFNREHQSAPPSLKQINGSREWWDSLEWTYPCPEHLFKKH